MKVRRTLAVGVQLCAALGALVGAPAAYALIPVIDVRAIVQMAQEVNILRSQLTTLQNQLSQARQDYQAMTGRRGMERLLAGSARNYLPPDWQELERVLQSSSTAYSTLSSEVRSVIEANAVLPSQQMAALSPWELQHVQYARRSAALDQVIAREALANTSGRFASLQQLISAIPAATDQKAVLDLQARIAAEGVMLQNEQAKLQLLIQVAQAEKRADLQRQREDALQSIGSMSALQPMGLLTR